jgi:hypothetical protein
MWLKILIQSGNTLVRKSLLIILTEHFIRINAHPDDVTHLLETICMMIDTVYINILT